MLTLRRILSYFAGVAVVCAQGPVDNPDCPVCVNNQLTDSFPHSYPGIPNQQYHYNAENREAWQKYYRVDTKSLPNATQCEMPSSYAGNVPINRSSINNTLFYWAVEHHPGSLTDPDNKEPWMIWLNGGPGTSSFVGLFFENGPCKISNNFSLFENPYAFSTLTDVMYIDQPTGVGFSTVNANDYAQDSAQAGRDFIGFLTNLAEIFPNLRKRQMFLTGESYAGVYIPQIAKAYFETPEKNRPTVLGGMVIADGSMGQDGTSQVPMVPMLETYPQIIDYSPDAYQYFKEQTHLCGYDVNLTFPQHEPLPSLQSPIFAQDRGAEAALFSQGRVSSKLKSASTKLRQLTSEGADHAEKVKRFWEEVNHKRTNALAPRSLPSFLPNNTINLWYDCYLLQEVVDYAVNFTEPWIQAGTLDVYYIPDGLGPEPPQDAAYYLNDHRTVNAIHAPTSKCWVETFLCDLSDYPWGSNTMALTNPASNLYGDLSPPPISFLSDLATNCSKNHVGIVFLDGNADLIIASASVMVNIQNFTFGNVRGFSQQPQTAWYDADGSVAGVVHQERGVKYVIFDNSGHLIGQWQPRRLKIAMEEFVFGNNKNGSIGEDGKLIGQELKLFNGFNIPALKDPIFTGSGTTMGSTLFPSATIAAWESFIATATLQPTPRH